MSDKKIANADSYTSSIQYAEKYLLRVAGSDTQKSNVARYCSNVTINVEIRAFGTNQRVVGSLTAETYVGKLPNVDNWIHCRSRGGADAARISILVRLQLDVGIFPPSNGRDKSNAT